MKNNKIILEAEKVSGYTLEYFKKKKPGARVYWHVRYGSNVMFEQSEGDGWPDVPEARKSAKRSLKAFLRFAKVLKVQLA